MTLVLYAVQMVYEFFWMFFTDKKTIGVQPLTAIFINIACIVVASYGIHHSWNEKYATEIKAKGELIEFHRAIQWLIWLRFFFICIWALFCFCLTLAIMANSNNPNQQQYGSGGYNNPNSYAQRIPGANAFLARKSRPAQEKDKSEQCAICLEDFKPGDGKDIVELNCKHVFHADCMKDWVKKNDICPMCRVPINP